MVRSQSLEPRGGGARTKPVTIGAAAKTAGIGVETIRFYERKGLVSQPARPAGGGARDYGPEFIARLHFIRNAKTVGFSLSEIAELLAIRDGRQAGCATVRARATAKRQDIQERLDKLCTMRDAIDEMIADCPGEGELSDCTILEAMKAGVK